MSFRITPGTNLHLSRKFWKYVFVGKSVRKYFSQISRKYIGEFSENSLHSWVRYITKRSLTGLARARLVFTGPWSFHTALASLGYMKDIGLVNPGTVLLPGNFIAKARLKTLCNKFSNRCCFLTMYQIFLIQISF